MMQKQQVKLEWYKISNIFNKAQPYKGIKGFCVLMDLPYMDVINHLDFDSMHGVALNVTLHFIQLWFSEEYKQHSFSLHCHKSDINSLLQKYKYPHKIKRIITTLDNFNDWKASQLR